jgi:hypothetical protein
MAWNPLTEEHIQDLKNHGIDKGSYVRCARNPELSFNVNTWEDFEYCSMGDIASIKAHFINGEEHFIFLKEVWNYSQVITKSQSLPITEESNNSTNNNEILLLL